eukprot:2444903-Karenia_brevis.AAC.1
MFTDVNKTHLKSECKEDVYLGLPEECNCPIGFCGELKRWMYGMRQAAAAWESHYSETLEEI